MLFLNTTYNEQQKDSVAFDLKAVYTVKTNLLRCIAHCTLHIARIVRRWCPFEQFVAGQAFQPQGEHELEHEPNKGESNNGEPSKGETDKGQTKSINSKQ